MYQIVHAEPFDRLPTCSVSHGDGWQFQNGWTQKAVDSHELHIITNQRTSRELNDWKTKSMHEQKMSKSQFCFSYFPKMPVGIVILFSSKRTWRFFLFALHNCLFWMWMRNVCSATVWWARRLWNTFSSSSHCMMLQAMFGHHRDIVPYAHPNVIVFGSDKIWKIQVNTANAEK